MQTDSFYSKYKYIRKLGQGGCGEVYLAENKVLGNLWAVKEILKDKKTSISGYIEPEILKRLNHPALPRICDVYEDETKIYIVEDYLEGTCLKQELDSKGKFEEQIVVDWAIQLCSVLEYLHGQKPNPIIYGDLKPHNIILTKDGFVKLVDFGVSTLMSYRENNRSNAYETAFIGTKGYAAPEQFLGQEICCTSDIYSLGITVIQLITGIDPIKSISIFQNKKYEGYISPELFHILQKCIEIKPQMRYQSAAALKKELQQFIKQKYSGEEYEKGRETFINFAKIIAITGARGTGISTITELLAEYMARGPTTVCIADLSSSSTLTSRLGKKLCSVEKNSDLTPIIKVNKCLYYSNLTSLIAKNQSEQPLLLRQLAQMQNSFSYVFLDVDITLLKYIELYLNQIFIVSDMNPYNILQIGEWLEETELAGECISRTSFIINKFYKGELSSRTILKTMLLEDDVSEQLQDLVIQAKIYEMPYDEKIYIKWMYSYFEEQGSFNKPLTKQLDQTISKIISDIVPIKNRVKKYNLNWRTISKWAKE